MSAGDGGLESMRERLLEQFAHGCDAPLAADDFEELALEIFRVQFRLNAPYRTYCERRGRTPAATKRAIDVPAVPTAAFRELRLITAPPGETRADAVFRTSGTTRGRERRGEHVVPDLSLYRSSLLPTFMHYVLPDRPDLDSLALVPPYVERPDSSLSCMIDAVMSEAGDGRAGWFVSDADGLDAARLLAALREAERAGRPVALLGTSLALVHLLDTLEQARVRLHLPHGSRLMDTGGFKGAGREVQPGTMAERYENLLGIPRAWQVNEYGMTELCSQMYDQRLRSAACGAAPSDADEYKAGPPWLRSTAVDPATLEPVPAGATGLLRHHDLANLGSVAAVQTEDVGRVLGDGTIELLGRMPGAQPRGCSIAMDLLLGRSG